MIENMDTSAATVQEPLQNHNTKKKSALSSRPRATRRVHGLQLPLHPLQLIGWIVILVTTFITFYFVIPSLSEPLRIIITVPLTLLYVLHSVAHIAALILDPAELELRKLDRSSVPEFDRTKHVHVIENGRCHLCNIHTSSLKTKHCSICNKCVDKFDHHCKWLNHCIGKRNYLPFFVTVITAVVLAFTVALICIAEVTIYYCNPKWLSWSRNSRVNETDTLFVEANSMQNKKDVIYISILVMFSLVTVTLGTLLLHLCLFHIYISYIGITTYEYIRKNEETSSVSYCTCKALEIETCGCSKNYGCLAKKPNILNWKIRERSKSSNFCAVKKSKVGDVSVTTKEQRARKQSGLKISSGQHHVASLRASIIENEIPNILKSYTSDIESNIEDTSIPSHAQILRTFFFCNYKNKRRKSIYRDRDKVYPTVEIQIE